MRGGLSISALNDVVAGSAAHNNLESFVTILEKWNPAINLVAPASLSSVWTRHVADSAQLFQLCPPTARRWVDIGSGGGFPGIVVAILAAESRPYLKVTLVEADQRKAVFLRTVSRETSLDITVIAERIERVERLNADVVSARALAPLAQLCSYADRHLSVGGTALFMKGARAVEEIDDARQAWQFKLTAHSSTTDPAAAILELQELSHV